MMRKRRLSLVIGIPLFGLLAGCGGDTDEGELAVDNDPPAEREETLQIVNQTVVPITGLRIDDADLAIELAPGGSQRVPLDWAPGHHSYSFQLLVTDPEGSGPQWTPPRRFEIPVDAREFQLVINANFSAENLAVDEWTKYHFEKYEYSIDLPLEPTIREEGRSLIAGMPGVSFQISCSETTLEDLGPPTDLAETIEKNGFEGHFEKTRAGEMAMHELVVLAHGRIYHLVMLANDDVMERDSQRFFDAFTIDGE